MYYIRFSDKVKRMMIKHTFNNPTIECGGFLYGNIVSEDDDLYCDVDAIYYEKDKIGDDCNFTFSFLYISRAYRMERNFDSLNLIGTYHSHGNYPALLSDVDRESLQKYFGKNKVTVVYSPKYSQIVGEYMDNDGCSHKMKILTK